MVRRKEAEERWETPSLEWIHRIRAERAKRGEMGPMPLEKQKALAAQFGSKLVRLRKRTEVRGTGEMTGLTISLPQRKLARLRRLAARIGVSPCELVRENIEVLLSKPDAAFEKAAARVLKKNAALHKRLA